MLRDFFILINNQKIGAPSRNELFFPSAVRRYRNGAAVGAVSLQKTAAPQIDHHVRDLAIPRKIKVAAFQFGVIVDFLSDGIVRLTAGINTQFDAAPHIIAVLHEGRAVKALARKVGADLAVFVNDARRAPTVGGPFVGRNVPWLRCA